METWIGLALTALGLLITGGGIVGRYWHQSVRADLAKLDKEFSEDVSKMDRELRDMVTAQTNGFRDSFTALREKINSVELHTEREFISKDTFGVVVSKLEKSIDNIGLKLDSISERLPVVRSS